MLGQPYGHCVFDFLLVGKSGSFLPLFIAPFRAPVTSSNSKDRYVILPNTLSSFRQNRTMSMRHYTIYPETF